MSLDGGMRPAALYKPGLLTIHPWSMQSIGIPLASSGFVTPASQNFVPAANTAIFIPFFVPEPFLVTKGFWGNGNPVAGNLDLGIYDAAGNRLVSSGSTLQATVSVLQIVDLTDTVLARGYYYMALASDTSGATQKVQAALVGSTPAYQAFGLLQQASAFPLPNPATFAKYASGAFMPMFGIQGYRTVGP